MHTYIYSIFFLLSFPALSQSIGDKSQMPEETRVDTALIKFYIVKGDTIAREAIDLDEVILLKKLRFNSKEDRRRYLILRRKTRKVYPFAKLAADRLNTMSERLKTLEDKSERRLYTRMVQQYIEEEFSEKLKKFTRTEGQILVKLIYRQTGRTAFDLVKDLRTGWRAFWYNTSANLFDISIKETYNPFDDEEDYIIEDVLQRSFQNNILEPQEAALPIDFLDLTRHWDNKRK